MNKKLREKRRIAESIISKNKINSTKGITIIALAITIIILIILASITIRFLTNGGIIDSAVDAANEYEKGKTNDSNDTQNLTNYLGSITEVEGKDKNEESTSSYWQVDPETGYIIQYIGPDVRTITELIIPKYIDGVEIKGIGPCEVNIMGSKAPTPSIQRVIIPDSIEVIRKKCF